MVDCASFTTVSECAITLTNEFNIKVIVLVFLLLASIIGLYYIKFVNKEETYLHYWFYYLVLMCSSIYLFFTPMAFMFLLKNSIRLETFYLIIIGFYGLAFSVVIGMLIYLASSKTFETMGVRDWNELEYKRKEKKYLRKNG